MILTNKEWIIRASDEQIRNNPDVRRIADSLGIRLPTAQLLFSRGCRTPESARAFLLKQTELFHNPFDLKDMRKAATALLDAVANGKKIAVYGDYDVDGVTSVCCLYLYLKQLGADVCYYIPSRTGEGYGMSKAALDALAKDGVRTIVTVDTGVTAVAEAVYARQLGITLVITDHHECCQQLPDAAAVVNPHRPDDTYPFKEMAGVGVVFKLLCAMESLSHPADKLGECVRRVAMQYGDLVAVGTIADVMPIVDENRLIVALGLRLIETSPRAGMQALLHSVTSESKSRTKKKITSSLIGFTIAPRINAAGRLRNASMAVDLFLASDAETAEQLAYRLCDVNRERQNEENKIVEQAYARIDSEHDFDKDPVVILGDESWHHGVIGIVSSRITERYGCPSILISFENPAEESGEHTPSPDDFGKGSGRSVKGMNLVEALSACSDLLEKFGGHELAAGLTVRRSNLEEFTRRINAYARTCFAKGLPAPVSEADCELIPEEICLELVEEMYGLEPYGTANPMPTFVTCSARVVDVSAVGAGKHIRFQLDVGGEKITAMYFRHGLADIDVYPGDVIDVMYNLDINEFQGRRSLQMILKEIRLSKDIASRENAEHNEYAFVCRAMEMGSRISPETAERVVPVRADFAAVYSKLKQEICLGHEVYSIRALRHFLASVGVHIPFAKLKFVLRILDEMRVLRADEVDTQREIYHFEYIRTQGKIDLEKSALLQKLRTAAQTDPG